MCSGGETVDHYSKTLLLLPPGGANSLVRQKPVSRIRFSFCRPVFNQPALTGKVSGSPPFPHAALGHKILLHDIHLRIKNSSMVCFELGNVFPR